MLIHDLKKDPLWSEQLSGGALNEALDNFKEIGGSNYYPHIYIPKMQAKEEAGLSSNEVYQEFESNEESPIFVFSAGDGATNTNEDKDIFKGYELINQDNKLTFIKNIDEDYSNNNEVWVIALNESVRGNGTTIYLMTDLGDSDPNIGGGAGSIPQGDVDPSAASRIKFDNTQYNDPTVNCKITNMIVAMHKESWVSGGSEVSIKAVLTCHNGRVNGERYPVGYLEYNSDQEGDRRGRLIRKFKRREVTNQTNINVNYSLQTNWPHSFLRDPSFFDFYIFEADDWPADKHKKRMDRRDDYRYPPNTFQNPFNSFWTDEYRSQKRSSDLDWHTPYVEGSICNDIQLTMSQQEFYKTGRFVKVGSCGLNTTDY